MSCIMFALPHWKHLWDVKLPAASYQINAAALGNPPRWVSASRFKETLSATWGIVSVCWWTCVWQQEVGVRFKRLIIQLQGIWLSVSYKRVAFRPVTTGVLSLAAVSRASWFADGSLFSPPVTMANTMLYPVGRWGDNSALYFDSLVRFLEKFAWFKMLFAAVSVAWPRPSFLLHMLRKGEPFPFLCLWAYLVQCGALSPFVHCVCVCFGAMATCRCL